MIPVLRGAATPTTSASAATPLIVLGPSLATRRWVWERVASQLAPHARVLAFDLPGHGASPVAAELFSIADLADAVVALVDAQGGGPFVYAGVSIGGAIGIELATGRHAGRLVGLAAICTAARIGDPAAWMDRAARVRVSGTGSQVAGSSARWFAPGFLARDATTGSRMLDDLLDVDDASYALACEALARWDRRADLDGVTTPVVAVSGALDEVVTGDEAAAFAAAVPGAQRVVLDGVGHQAHAEAPSEVSLAVLSLLRAADDGRAEQGMRVRRAVFGDAYVDAATAAATADTADWQRFITETAWGSVWTREGLSRRERSLLTIASLATAHHWHELGLHLAGALRNGVTREELREALLHLSVYAGVPSANTAFGLLRDLPEEPR